MTTQRRLQPDDLLTRYDFTGSERDIEMHMMENIHYISKQTGWGDIRKTEQQFRMPIAKGMNKTIIADIMIWHSDGTGTVVEVKKKQSSRLNVMTAMSQLLFYGYAMESILGNMPRLVFACNEIDHHTYDVASRYNLPICFLVVDGDRIIHLPPRR